MKKGLIEKTRMTQVFSDERDTVTVIEAGPCDVIKEERRTVMRRFSRLRGEKGQECDQPLQGHKKS